MFRAVDNIQHNFQHCNADISTCLRLLLTEPFIPALPDNHPATSTFISPVQLLHSYPTMQKLTGADILYYNQETHSLKLHDSPTHMRYKVSSNRAISYINTNQLLFQPFVLYNLLQVAPRSINHVPDINTDPQTNITMLQSFLTYILSLQFNLFNYTHILANDSIKSYKLLPLKNTYTPSPSFTTFSTWTELWSLQIPLNAKNTWYRIIHDKITP